jgi:hypothetical protein
VVVHVIDVQIGIQRERAIAVERDPKLQELEGLAVDDHGGVDGLGEVGDCGERLVVDVDEFDRVLGHVPTVGDDERDRVADELRLALGQWRAWRVRDVLARNGVPSLLDVGVEIVGGEHRVHAGQG